MNLSNAQISAAAAGQFVRFSEGGVEFVVVRSEVYDKLAGLLESDHDELRLMLARSSEANGWDEPGMEAYDAHA